MEWRPAGWSVCLPPLILHHKVRKFFSGTGSPGWSRKKGCKMVVVVAVVVVVVSVAGIQTSYYRMSVS